MIDQNDLIEKIVDLLNSSRIPYMLSGSMCSSFYGKPRSTNDADIVIDPTKEQLEHFLNALGSDCCFSRDASMQALENNSMFNVIDIQSGLKTDFIIRKKRSFSKEEFARRKVARLMGLELCIVSPEDSILSKLEWSKESQSQMQFNDVINVLDAQWESLDFEYLKKWAKELQVEESLGKLIEEIKKLK